MTDATTPSEPGTTAAIAAHNRSKVYVSGPQGVQVPFIEVSLSDSPARNGASPNPPVRLYDTSGPGSVPSVGLPSLRSPWITARADVEEYEGRPVNRRDDGRGAVRRDGDGPAAFPLDGRRPRRSTGEPGHPAALRPPGGDHPGDGLRGHPRRSAGRTGPRRGRRRPGDPAGQRQPPGVRADGDRVELPGEGQCQHRQLGRLLVHRGGGPEVDLGHPLGRGHGHGPVHRTRHPHHPGVDPAQLAGPDRDGPDLPGPGEGRRRAGGARPGTSTATR